MVSDQQMAIVLLGADRPAGRWADYGDLVRYGWKKDADTDADNSVGQNALEDGKILQDLSIDAEEKEKDLVDHSRNETADGREYTATGAYLRKAKFNNTCYCPTTNTV
ncbi:hypothetical protein BDV10DRAFT_183906 [Aspergillus recurvatus]